MNLKLHVGPYRSGKTSAAIKEALEYARANPFVESVFITPSARSRKLIERRLRTEMACADFAASGVMGLRIVTINQFVAQHAFAAGAISNVASDQLCKKILVRVLDAISHQEHRSPLASILTMPGTAAEILKLVHEFQRAALTPAQVKGALDEGNPDDPQFQEFAEIYRRYWEELEQRDWLDQKTQATQVNQLLQEHHCPNVHYGMVLFDGFDRYSRLQAQLAHRLSTISDSVTVVFDCSPDSADYAWKRGSYDLLLKELSVAPNMVPQHPASNPVKHEYFSALDRFAEMQEIARRCKILIVEEGVKASDILVVARSISPYLGAVETAFEGSGIPYFVDHSCSLMSVPVAQFVNRLLSLSVNDFQRADVISILRSPYFERKYAGLTEADIDSIDRISLESSVLGGRSSWQRCMKDKSSHLQHAVSQLFKETSTSEGHQSLSQFCQWCETLLEKAADINSKNLLDYNSQAAVSQIRGTIALLVEEENMLGAEPLTYQSFYQKLLESFEADSFPSQPCFKEYVTVCGADVAPNRLFHTVFIAGMVEGQFPRNDHQSPFAGREALAAWRRLGVPVDDPRTNPGFEDALLNFLLDCASDNLVLSSPLYEMSGEELLPSFALRRILPLETKNHNFLRLFEDSKQHPCSAREAVATVLWHEPVSDISTLNTIFPAMTPPLAVLSRLITDSRSRLQSSPESVFNGYLTDLVSSGVLAVPFPDQWSATTLQHYAQCPFQFWVSDILRLSPAQEPELGLESKLAGTFYHYVLENFYRNVIAKELVLERTNEQALKDLLNVAIDQGIAWLESSNEFHKDEFWDYQQAYLRLLLHRFLDFELANFEDRGYGLKPAMCEVKFGQGVEYPALEIPTDNGSTIKIRGIIDRVDLSAVEGDQVRPYARVVDYKRTASRITRKGVIEGRYLQIPLYALAVEKVIAPGSKMVGARYLSINDAESPGSFVGPEKMQGVMSSAIAHTIEYDRQIRSGNFLLDPISPSVCDYCEHKAVCRITERNIREDSEENAD